MELPSKELLSAVLGEDVKSVELWKENTIRYFAPKDYIINIYELQHLMKEWAREHGYLMSTEMIEISDDGFNHKWYLGINKEWWFHGVTEFEAVTKACEYILEQIDKNSEL